MSKKRNKKKKHKLVINEGESNAKLFITRLIKKHNSGVLTNSELESAILNLISKFDMAEVIQYLPVEHHSFLKEISSREEKVDEDNFLFSIGCFGPEFECEQYIANQKKSSNKVNLKIKEFYQKIKK